MSGLSKSSKDSLVKQHMDITKSLDTDARRLLKANRWQLSNSVDAYYDDEQAMANAEARDRKGAGGQKVEGNLNTLFDHYGGKGSNQLDFDATASWCRDLAIDLESDVVVFAIAELTKAPTMGYFNRKEWIDGWRAIKKDSIESQRGHIDTLRKEMTGNEEYYRKVYTFVFDYAKEEGQKSLSLDIAAGLWPLLFSSAPASMFSSTSAFTPSNPSQQTTFLSAWTSFLRNEKKGRSVSKDVWSLFLDFATTIDPKFETYDLDAAWPSLIDEFVDFAKERLEKGESLGGGEEDEMEE